VNFQELQGTIDCRHAIPQKPIRPARVDRPADPTRLLLPWVDRGSSAVLSLPQRHLARDLKPRFRLPTLKALGGYRAGCKKWRCMPYPYSADCCRATPFRTHARLTNGKGRPCVSLQVDPFATGPNHHERGLLQDLPFRGRATGHPPGANQLGWRGMDGATELLPFDPQSRKAWTCERRVGRWPPARAVTPRGFNFILAERVISESFGNPSPLSCGGPPAGETGMAVQVELLSLRRSIWPREL
jgi:hypothetical protein